MTSDYVEQLSQIKKAYEKADYPSKEVLEFDKNLRKARYLPYFDFLKHVFLADKQLWKSLSAKGFTYFKDKIDEKIFEQAIQIFEKSPDRSLRMDAVNVLSLFGKKSETFLFSALEKIEDKFIGGSIVSSILSINNLPPYISLGEFDRITADGIIPNKKYIEEIINRS